MQNHSTRRAPRSQRYFLPAEAAALLLVSPQTLSRWAERGYLPYQRTAGGHHRYSAEAVHRLARSLRPMANGDAGQESTGGGEAA